MSQSAILWTLDELGAQVALALVEGYDGQASGRVREVPDARTIRYYTTLGLIDRPAQLRGRTAVYGRRHLLQVVAIKRLQARGLSLAEVQTQLLGATDATLRRVAQLPAGLEEGAAATGEARAGEKTEPRNDSFWRAVPAPPSDPPEVEKLPPGLAYSLQGIRLSDAATLLVAADRPIHEDDIEALRTAAAPLLKLLEKRRLIRPR